MALRLEVPGELDFELVSLGVLADRLRRVVDGRRPVRVYHRLDVQRILRLPPADGQVDIGQVRGVEVDFGHFLAEELGRTRGGT